MASPKDFIFIAITRRFRKITEDYIFKSWKVCWKLFKCLLQFTISHLDAAATTNYLHSKRLCFSFYKPVFFFLHQFNHNLSFCCWNTNRSECDIILLHLLKIAAGDYFDIEAAQKMFFLFMWINYCNCNTPAFGSRCKYHTRLVMLVFSTWQINN